MPKIRMTHQYQCGKESAIDKLNIFLLDFAPQYQLATEWRGDTLHIRRKGIDGQMKVGETVLDIHVELSWMMKPFAKNIEAGLRQGLAQHLA